MIAKGLHRIMPKRLSHFLLALSRALFQDMLQGDINLRAMSLVYTTLLSMAPLLALSFSVLKGFGVHNQLEPLLFTVLAPLGAKAAELTQQILGFVDNIQVGVLGVTGLAVLLYTVISLMQKIEGDFNYIWQVKRSRSITAQARDYLSVIMVGPILMFSAIGVWTSLGNISFVQSIAAIQPFGLLLTLLLKLVPTVLVILTFTLMYLFIPNTHVKIKAALGGGMIAGLAWQAGGWGFAAFVVSSGQQTAIYSVFASLFLFMLWLYFGWLIVLTGARLAYYFQYPDAIYRPTQPIESSLETKEILAAAVLREIGLRFLNKQPPVTLDLLRQQVPVSRFLLECSLEELVDFGILSRDDNEPPHYLLRIAPENLTVTEIRRYFWQGHLKQQQQAQEVRRQAGLTEAWLTQLANQPHTDLQSLLKAEQLQLDKTH